MARVSIVIPLYNRVELTRTCVDALRETAPGCEVLLVDNGSTDGTADYVASLAPPFVGLRQETNLGFSGGCNAGAARATGELLLFLNNDTRPRPGWLEPLVAALDDATIGVAGARLLFPETGLLQHAGVLFNEERVPCHAYYNLPADLPEANVARDYPVVTGACLLIRRALFEEIGGFDVAYTNGYEDVELCLRAADRGARVRYVPQSVVEHFEGMSEGRHALEDRNLALLRERHGDRLRGGPMPDRDALARYGEPLLRASSRSRYVCFRGRTLYRADRIPARVTRHRASYWPMRLWMALRYLAYAPRVARLRKRAAAGAPAASPAAAPPRGRNTCGHGAARRRRTAPAPP